VGVVLEAVFVGSKEGVIVIAKVDVFETVTDGVGDIVLVIVDVLVIVGVLVTVIVLVGVGVNVGENQVVGVYVSKVAAIEVSVASVGLSVCVMVCVNVGVGVCVRVIVTVIDGVGPSGVDGVVSSVGVAVGDTVTVDVAPSSKGITSVAVGEAEVSSSSGFLGCDNKTICRHGG
jgi:hypothetical protein